LSFSFLQFLAVPIIAAIGDASMMTPSAWFFPSLFDKELLPGYNSGLFITFPTCEPTGIILKSNFNA
jgi:hypothetical protein